jgi:4-amino-4-deoxy-L-arabinose transferase-like glycosyltransferase
MIKTWIVIVSLFLLAAFVGNMYRPVDKIQEARIAETAREMVTGGQWLVPHYNGELRLQKPPLTYWTTATSYALLGVSEIATRIPSFFFVFATLLLMWHWLSRRLDLSTAVIATLIIMTSFLGMRYLRSGEADATLMFCIILAMYGGFEFFTREARHVGMLWLWYIGMGLGFFAKGPAGIAIPFLSLVIFAFYSQQRTKLLQLWHWPAISVFMLIAFGWYLLIWHKVPEAAAFFFQKQVDDTFVSGTHKQPIYWYLLHAFEFFSPWSLFILPMALWLSKSIRLPACIQFALVWLLTVFVLLTATVNKQIQYALLLLPPLSVVLAYYLSQASGKFFQFNRVIQGLVFLMVPVVVLFFGFKHGWEKARHMPEIALLLFPVLFSLLFNPPWLRKDALMIATASIFLFLWVAQYQAESENNEDIKQLMQMAKLRSPLFQNATVGGHGAVSFYAGRVVPPLSLKQMPIKLAEVKRFWWVSKDQPDQTRAMVVAEQRFGKWTLWRLDTPISQP